MKKQAQGLTICIGIVAVVFAFKVGAAGALPECDDKLLSSHALTAAPQAQFSPSIALEFLKIDGAEQAVVAMLQANPHPKLKEAVVKIMKRDRRVTEFKAFRRLIRRGYRIHQNDFAAFLLALTAHTLAGKTIEGKDFKAPNGGYLVAMSFRFSESLKATTVTPEAAFQRNHRVVRVLVNGVDEGYGRFILRWNKDNDGVLSFTILDEREQLPLRGLIDVRSFNFVISPGFLRGEVIGSDPYGAAGVGAFNYHNRWTNQFYGGAKAWVAK